MQDNLMPAMDAVGEILIHLSAADFGLALDQLDDEDHPFTVELKKYPEVYDMVYNVMKKMETFARDLADYFDTIPKDVRDLIDKKAST